MHTKKDHVEKRLRRRSGMSVEKREAMRIANDKLAWTVICRKCRVPTTALKADLIECSNCGNPFR